MQVRKDLSEGFDNFELLIFGSCLNGLFDNQESDLDLTIITESTDHYKTLEKCRRLLDKHP
jgi:predicted nucleotidyltransferase